MLYREVGQFKTSYAKDQQIFPIFQDRVALFLLICFDGVKFYGALNGGLLNIRHRLSHNSIG